jgi:hypothetical protein
MVGALIGFTDIARKALILPSFGATASGRVGKDRIALTLFTHIAAPA